MKVSLWNQSIKYLERELPNQEFNMWIRPLHVVEEDDTIRLLAPNAFVLQWVKNNYYQRITATFALLKPKKPPTLILQVGSRQRLIQSTPIKENATKPIDNSVNNPPVYTNQLNKNLTFETFVEGKSNQLARAVSFQTAEQGGYNPLFIYGGVGLGKTHLMQAIGNHLFMRNPQVKIGYIRAERFVNDMVTALRLKQMTEFKNYYRSLDMLLLDDVQFFANKTHSQEELFHTFNDLLERQKAIILTCDRVPQRIEGLEERLISRFSWGLTVEITPPDIETRLEILLTKARLVNVNLPQEVGYFIAKHIRSNVRELEGALHRLIAAANLMRQVISLESAQLALKDLLSSQKQSPTLNRIQKVVADYFNIPASDLCSKSRSRLLTRRRQIAISLSKELTQHSLPEIGEAFGGRDHTTVIYSCKTIAKLKGENKQIHQDYTNLLKQLDTQFSDHL